MRNFLDKFCGGENQTTRFMFNFFPRKSRLLWGNGEKYGTARQATDGNILWCRKDAG
jgi:hypothetical protein